MTKYIPGIGENTGDGDTGEYVLTENVYIRFFDYQDEEKAMHEWKNEKIGRGHMFKTCNC